MCVYLSMDWWKSECTILNLGYRWTLQCVSSIGITRAKHSPAVLRDCKILYMPEWGAGVKGWKSSMYARCVGSLISGGRSLMALQGRTNIKRIGTTWNPNQHVSRLQVLMEMHEKPTMAIFQECHVKYSWYFFIALMVLMDDSAVTLSCNTYLGPSA